MRKEEKELIIVYIKLIVLDGKGLGKKALISILKVLIRYFLL